MATQAGAYPRAPDEAERRIINFLLSSDDPAVAPLRRQATTAQVVAKCPCGCASIDLLVDRATEASPIGAFATINADSTDRDDPDHLHTLIAFIRDGYLQSIEIVYYNDSPPATFPAPTAFDPPYLIATQTADTQPPQVDAPT